MRPEFFQNSYLIVYNLTRMKFDKDDYILSFWVQGVSVFVTDIHVDVYKELEVLFLIDEGMFKQYFARAAYEKALERGLKFYSDKNAFANYKKELTQHCTDFKEFFNKEIRGKKKLSINTVKTFFEYTVKLCKDYTLMNFEHTDKAFSRQNSNPIIKKNLSEASKFKEKIRSYMNEVLFEPNGYTSQLFKILGNQFHLTPSVMENLTQQEILDLFDNKNPDEKSLPGRQTSFAINFDRDFYQGQKALNIIKAFRDDHPDDNVVTGNTASLGNVTGRVKVINVDYSDIPALNREIAKMAQGDILVAETTAPELILACKKAAAIVTDVGGLLSHAAIVSREFDIPCIVGTENATKIFKDGDIVVVDGEKGTVTRIQ